MALSWTPCMSTLFGPGSSVEPSCPGPVWNLPSLHSRWGLGCRSQGGAQGCDPRLLHGPEQRKDRGCLTASTLRLASLRRQAHAHPCSLVPAPPGHLHPCPVVLTQLIQVGPGGPLRHGRDGHQGTHVSPQRPAEHPPPEVNLPGVHALLQEVKVSLGERSSRKGHQSQG